jgi:TonB-dependent SusC/RagA subfamily outer membrane receptor
VKVSTASIIDVKLIAIASELNEVVVTSFNISKDKKTLGYATQQVNGDEIAETQRENFLTALQSRVAGATINTTSGAPGASSQIVLRGFNSLSGNNSPLIVVDGLPISNSTFDQNNLTVQGSNRSNDFTNRAADINPNDIASITVLKGPEATSLYGIDAGSGAIIITTKKGAAGKLKVSYDNSFRIDHMYLYPEIQTTYGLGVLGDGAQRTRSALGPKISDTTKIYNNVKNFFNDAFVQKHNVTLDGGKNRLAYRLSLGSTNQNGTIPNTGLDRYNARGTLSYNSLRKNFDANLSLAYTYSENQKAHPTFKRGKNWHHGLYS